jgi:tetratricopeptide (TPR) repeat protein
MPVFDFITQALRASGLSDPEDISIYGEKLDQLTHSFLQLGDKSKSIYQTAADLFQWLWGRKPNRYQAEASFRLYEVTDAWQDRARTVIGNCLGLTLLYNALLKGLGVEAGAVYLENQFPQRPHVFSYLILDDKQIDVDHMLPDGYDCDAYRENTERVIWSAEELVAEIYHSAGNTHFKENILDQARICYAKALELNPRHHRIRYNLMILADREHEKDT